MSDEQRNEPANHDLAEGESTNTADVREAIERARESTEHQPYTGSTDAPQAGQTGQSDHAATAAQPAYGEQSAFTQSAGTGQSSATTEHSAAGEATQVSGYSPEEHVSINTERMQVTERQEMPSASPPVDPVHPITPFATGEPAQPMAQAAYPQAEAQPMTIAPDHPMAPLYFQQPNPPTLRSNRLAGVLISLLATLAFAVLYAGVLALTLAQDYPPSRFLNEGLLPYVSSLGFILPVVAFFIGMVILVLIFNRAGWWVYVLFGLLVAALVWATAGAGYSLSPQLAGEGDLAREYGLSLEHIASFALTIPGIIAGLAAREVAVWFGAWIGARGRRMKRRNTEAMREYEAKLQELQVPQQS